jgi:hypothetical protein
MELGRHTRDYAALLAVDAESTAAERTTVFDLVGRSIANAHLLLDLEVVAFLAACPPEFRHGLAIRLGALGPYCGAIGAAAQWRDDTGE